MRLGIDYGTSHTVAVLAWPDGRRRALHFGSSALLPSAVHAGSDGILRTGQDALRAGLGEPAGLEPNPKRRVDDGEVLLGETAHPVGDLIAATLRAVWDEAVRVAGGPPAEVTLTHPADWGPLRRGLLAEAARRSGIGEPSFLSEPVAAATFFVTEGAADVPVGSHAVVYDLGAGTFDVSLVRRTGEGFEVLAAGGLGDVGGLDLDGVVVERVGALLARTEPAVWRRLTDPVDAVELRARHALWSEARGAKEALSRAASASLFVPLLDRDSRVSREEFETGAAPILDRTAALMVEVVARTGVEWSQVAAVFLVGGSSRVPLAATLVHRACGIAPTVVEQPELVVAEGAVLAPRRDRRSAEPGAMPPLPPDVARVLDVAIETFRQGESDEGGELAIPRVALLEYLAATDFERAHRLTATLDFEDEAFQRALDDIEDGSPIVRPEFVLSLPDAFPARPHLLEDAAFAVAADDPALAARLMNHSVHAATALPDGTAKVSALIKASVAKLMVADPELEKKLAAMADFDLKNDLFVDVLRSQGFGDRAEGMRLLGEAELLTRRLSGSDPDFSVWGVLIAAMYMIDPRRCEELARPILPGSAFDFLCLLFVPSIAQVDTDHAAWLCARAEAIVESVGPTAFFELVCALEPVLRSDLADLEADELEWRSFLGYLEILIPAVAAVDPSRIEPLLSRIPEDEPTLCRALHGAMGGLARTDPDQAVCLALALNPDAEEDRDGALTKLVTALAKHDPDRAARLLPAFTDDTRRAEATRTLAKVSTEQARRLSELLSPHDVRGLATVAGVLAETDVRAAETALLAIAPDADADGDWPHVADVVARIAENDADAAERVTRHLPPGGRAGSAGHTVAALARTDADRAEALLRDSLTDGDAELPGALAAVAKTLIAGADGFMSSARRRGQRLFDEAEQAARTHVGPTGVRALAELAAGLAEADAVYARSLLDEAENACAALESADERAAATRVLVKAWLAVDTGRAEILARAIPDSHRRERVDALLDIVRYLRPFKAASQPHRPLGDPRFHRHRP